MERHPISEGVTVACSVDGGWGSSGGVIVEGTSGQSQAG